ncbi:hypothetical protein Ddye_029873 [Dipteronia dyeriana]|uniref:BED-type domain-containing protein n=1 Tax=Dipteronia dyeriana TaxID=168575 RepID=A0AAD9TFK9_9ROSI|nr:hypothetical protein Ddye_029873 [Dipteronia dyeriana]
MTSFERSQVNVSTGSGNNEVEDVEPRNASDGFKRKRETSFVWNYMTKVDVNGIRMEKCDFCEKLLNATQGTSSLRKHVLKCLDDHQEATNSTNTSFDQNVGFFVRAKHYEPQYKCLPDESDWQLATIMVERLKPFYKLTEFFLGTKYPTTNIVFPMICNVRETMNGWLNSRYNEIQVMARCMIAKFDKYWSDIPGVMAVAVVFDPRYKMLLVDFHFSKIYGSSASREREIVHELLKDLIKEYELGSSLVE